MKVQDIHTTDSTLWQQYVQAFAAGQYSTAIAILKNAQLDSKTMTANVFNEANNCVANMEELYYTNVEDVLASELTTFNQMIAALVAKQDYNAATVYVKGNFVVYNDTVYVYINEAAASGHAPTDTTYWLYLGLRGQQGAEGVGLTLRYQWAQNVQYAKYDVVLYGDKLWFANEANVNSPPSESDTTWSALMDVPVAKIYTGSVAPSSPYEGLIWVQEM